MSVTYDPSADRYFVAPQSGPAAMGYGNYSVPSCWGGDSTTLCGNPHGPYFQTTVRERLRDVYANGVQGGSPACKNQAVDAQTASGLRPPFLNAALNYFGSVKNERTDNLPNGSRSYGKYAGDLDPFRNRPYDVGYSNVGIAAQEASDAQRQYDAFGHYVQNSCLTGSCQNTPTFQTGGFGCSAKYQQPLMILPIPGFKSAKTFDSVAFPGPDNQCTKTM